MHIHSVRQKANASTLVVTLLICAILCFTILGYLALIEQQGRLGSRSQSWNIAISVVEAGIEDALQHLNNNHTNLTADGWSASADFYWKSNVLASGSAYYVRIWATNITYPAVVCQAYVTPVGMVQNAMPTMFAATPTPSVSSPYISRAVRVKCWRGSLFLNALAARHLIDLNGNNIMTDSFDSTDPAFSGYNGQYDPARAKEKGDVASNDTLINVGNANIFGHVSTGPGGKVNVGSLGGVGTHSYQLLYPGQIEPGWMTDDSNFTFPDTGIPYTSGLDAEPGDIIETVTQIISNSTTSATPPDNPWGGVQSNVVNTTTYTSLPNPIPPGMTTNVTSTTGSVYPANAPAGTVNTNITGSITVNAWPGAGVGAVVTNPPVWVKVNNLPNPVPSGTITNTTPYNSTVPPKSGEYVGVVNVHDGTYYYAKITSYNYPIYSYTYYTYSYTYPVYKYIVPTYSFTYNLYTTNIYNVTNHYDHVLNTGKYYVETLSGKTIVLGKAELVCGNGVTMSGNDVIKIAKGGSLTNWIGGTTVSLMGNGVVNETGLAANYVALCDPSVTTINLGGNGEFIGVLIAPEGNINMHGGGGAYFDFVGCLMVNSATMTGHYKFHYDESLGRLAGNGRYLITTWDEIPPEG